MSAMFSGCASHTCTSIHVHIAIKHYTCGK